MRLIIGYFAVIAVLLGSLSVFASNKAEADAAATAAKPQMAPQAEADFRVSGEQQFAVESYAI